MGFGQAVSTCFSKYATFSGRATRSEFWWFQLFAIIITGIPILLGMIFLVASSGSSADGSPSGALALIGIFLYVIGFLVSLVLVIPNLSVGCRRLHDRGTSGWLQLLLLVPCGGIVLIIFWLLEGTPGDNSYGAKPINA